MKFTPSFSAGVLSLALVVSASAQSDPLKFELPQVGSGSAAPAAQSAPQPQQGQQQPAAPVVTFTEGQMLEVYGYMLGDRLNLRALEFTPAQVDAVARGMSMAASGKVPEYDAQQIVPQLQELLGKKQQVLLGKIRDANREATAQFFTKLKENAAVKELPGSNGLRYEVLKEGKGAIAKAGQVARIHYTGAFVNGQIFDTSERAPEGQTAEPVEVLVQQGALIDGMTEALLKMPAGSRWRLYVPPHLAYGDDGNQGIPPAATLIFEVEVLEVKDAPKDANAQK